ncbi:MAG: AI-2E family transporter [Deltaproteobacteria bacterium]|nr:AI-2E family transporter [Deltaproteobacteria bacterium]
MSEPTPVSKIEPAALVLAVLAVLFVLVFHLLPAAIAGLLVHELVGLLAPLFAKRFSTKTSKAVAVGVIVTLVVGAISSIAVAATLFSRSEGGSIPALFTKMAEILESSRAALPAWLSSYVPESTEGLREDATKWLREHAAELQVLGKETGRALAHILVGMVIGGLLSFREVTEAAPSGPLARALSERGKKLASAFRRIVFAQVRISAINTTLTGLYLAVGLRLFGVDLPLTKTLIAVTFLAGLLPVIGNLISNTVIFVVSFAHSPAVALASIVFLVVIHKLEYFLNARIVGSQIRSEAWELLTAMLAMEAAFGVAGLVAAPICYAWAKDELGAKGWI